MTSKRTENTKPRVLIIGPEEGIRQDVKSHLDSIFGKVEDLQQAEFDRAAVFIAQKTRRILIVVLCGSLVRDREERENIRQAVMSLEIRNDDIYMCEGAERDLNLMTMSLLKKRRGYINRI